MFWRLANLGQSNQSAWCGSRSRRKGAISFRSEICQKQKLWSFISKISSISSLRKSALVEPPHTAPQSEVRSYRVTKMMFKTWEWRYRWVVSWLSRVSWKHRFQVLVDVLAQAFSLAQARPQSPIRRQMHSWEVDTDEEQIEDPLRKYYPKQFKNILCKLVITHSSLLPALNALLYIAFIHKRF